MPKNQFKNRRYPKIKKTVFFLNILTRKKTILKQGVQKQSPPLSPVQWLKLTFQQIFIPEVTLQIIYTSLYTHSKSAKSFRTPLNNRRNITGCYKISYNHYYSL